MQNYPSPWGKKPALWAFFTLPSAVPMLPVFFSEGQFSSLDALVLWNPNGPGKICTDTSCSCSQMPSHHPLYDKWLQFVIYLTELRNLTVVNTSGDSKKCNWNCSIRAKAKRRSYIMCPPIVNLSWISKFLDAWRFNFSPFIVAQHIQQRMSFAMWPWRSLSPPSRG